MRNHKIMLQALLTSVMLSTATLTATLTAAQTAQPDTCPPPLQAPTKEQALQAYAKAQDRGFLWSLSKDGRTSYLFGTIHLGSLETSLPGPSLTKALRVTNKIALELNMSDPAELAVLHQPASADLAKVKVSEAQAKQLEELLRENCASEGEIAQGRNMHPILRSIALTGFAARKHGKHAAYSSELVLLGFAMQTKREILGLETAQSQLETLIGKDDEQAQLFFDELLNSFQRDKRKASVATQRVIKMWEESDLSDLHNYEQWCECQNTATERALMKRLLEDRNAPMAERIDSMLSKGDKLLIAVGALHMTGNQGLPALLEQKGYVVQQLIPAPK